MKITLKRKKGQGIGGVKTEQVGTKKRSDREEKGRIRNRNKTSKTLFLCIIRNIIIELV